MDEPEVGNNECEDVHENQNEPDLEGKKVLNHADFVLFEGFYFWPENKSFWTLKSYQCARVNNQTLNSQMMSSYLENVV